ncbi:hypothetical protein J6590_011374 [Homalodisca vitripennis]|nr:hypothetical protein J6590_011374 [Homalodisca vitripennis]
MERSSGGTRDTSWSDSPVSDTSPRGLLTTTTTGTVYHLILPTDLITFKRTCNHPTLYNTLHSLFRYLVEGGDIWSGALEGQETHLGVTVQLAIRAPWDY